MTPAKGHNCHQLIHTCHGWILGSLTAAGGIQELKAKLCITQGTSLWYISGVLHDKVLPVIWAIADIYLHSLFQVQSEASCLKLKEVSAKVLYFPVWRLDEKPREHRPIFPLSLEHSSFLMPVDCPDSLLLT